MLRSFFCSMLSFACTAFGCIAATGNRSIATVLAFLFFGFVFGIFGMFFVVTSSDQECTCCQR